MKKLKYEGSVYFRSDSKWADSRHLTVCESMQVPMRRIGIDSNKKIHMVRFLVNVSFEATKKKFQKVSNPIETRCPHATQNHSTRHQKNQM